MRERTDPAEGRELVVALCHELGNWLAASRMQAGRLAAPETAEIAETLSALAARAGHAVALLRALVAEPQPPTRIRAADALDALERDLEDAALARVRFAGPAEGLTCLGEPGALHAILSTALHHALDGAGPAGGVTVSARQSAGAAVFEIAVDDGGAVEVAAGPALRGAALAIRVSDALLRPADGSAGPRLGGGFEVRLPRAD